MPSLWSKYDEYIKLAAPNERAFLALQKIISEDIVKKNWTNAANTVASYLPYFQSNRKKIDNLLSILNKPFDPNIKVNNLGPNINTVQGGEYTPFITADDKNLYFCGRNRDNFNLDEDIFVSKRGQNGFKPATAITELNETGNNQAPLSLSADGTSMILFIDGKLSLAEKNIDNKWEILESFPETINSGTWQADARITSDKKALIFSSIRPTNFDYYPENNLSNYHGAVNYPCDIYVSVRDENDEWTEPINLGPTINTIYSDRSPFLHPDMKTLYFASDGHGGLGNYDLFKSTRLADTCWDCWSEPVNLGKEFNTAKGDWGLDISTDGDKAYFSKGVEASGKNVTVNNEFDIFWSNIPGYLRPNYVATINGKLVDSKNQPVVANIRWEDLEAKKVIGIAKSDPEDGSYFIVLPLGKLYGYYIDDDNLFPVSSSIDLRNYKLQININNDIKIITYQDMLDNKVSASMNNIFFKTGSSSLEPTSLPELKRIASIIKEKNVKVNILGHTDNIGSDAVNVALSLERANKIKQILINEGCNDADVITKGMGKSMPIASNNTEAGRAKNRRVDIIFEKK
jgi:outer membrane protein OmpA-like peptidoglycan-associated protein